MSEGSKSPGEVPSFLLCQRQAPRIAGHADMQACRHADMQEDQDTRTPGHQDTSVAHDPPSRVPGPPAHHLRETKHSHHHRRGGS